MTTCTVHVLLSFIWKSSQEKVTRRPDKAFLPKMGQDRVQGLTHKQLYRPVVGLVITYHVWSSSESDSSLYSQVGAPAFFAQQQDWH